MTTEKLTETTQNLKNTKVTLKETKVTLRNTEQDRNEQRFLVDEHVKTETQLYSQATEVGSFLLFHLSLVMRKLAFCICENKAVDFRYIDSTIFLLSRSQISSLYPSSVRVQPGLCQTWSETPKTGFV